MEHLSVAFLGGNWTDEAQTQLRPGQISSSSDAGEKSNLKINPSHRLSMGVECF